MSTPSHPSLVGRNRRLWLLGSAALLVFLAGGWMYFMSRPAPLDSRVVICWIDPASREAHGPWTRAQLAKLVEALDAAGARAVALALPADEGASAPAAADRAWEDEALAAALATLGRAVLAYPAELGQAGPSVGAAGAAGAPRVEVDGSAESLAALTRREDSDEELRAASWGEGFVEARKDLAGAVVARNQGQVLPSFALAAVAAFESRQPRWNAGSHSVEIGPNAVRLDRGGRVKVRPLDLEAAGAGIGAADVLAGRGERVAGRLVVVGLGEPGDPGSEPSAISLAREAALMSWLLGGADEARRRLGVAVATALGLLLAPLLVGMALSFGGTFGGKKRAEQEEIKRLFAGRLPATVLERWLEHPAEAPLTMNRRQGTALVGEMSGFMELVDSLAPDRLAVALGSGLATVRERVLAEGGLVESLDTLGLRAVFGGPLAVDNPAGRACGAALAIRQALATERAALAAGHELPLARVNLRVELGIASGTLVVGVLGGGASAYQVVGSPVIAATRLVRLCRGYGVSILLSEAVAAAAGDTFLVRELDRVRLRGLPQALTLFELVTANPAAPADRQRVVRYEAGLAAYRQREFMKAERLFTSILEDLGEDGAARMMAERCRRFRATPPPENWDGTAAVSG